MVIFKLNAFVFLHPSFNVVLLQWLTFDVNNGMQYICYLDFHSCVFSQIISVSRTVVLKNKTFNFGISNQSEILSAKC